MTERVLEVQNLVKYFPVTGSRDMVHAVNDVSFEIHRGETLALVGESGSGKTTTGRCVLRLIEPTSGHIYLEGQDICAIRDSQMRGLRPKIQMVFQEPYESLNPRMTVSRIIEDPLRMDRSKNTRERQRRVEELIELVRLSPRHLDQYPHQLSGSQQQRVGIARAIATEPDLLVLDEPTSALDISVRAEIMELLMQLQEQLGLSYLFISHDLLAVRHISDRVAVMYLGQIVETGTAQEIFSAPIHPYARALISSVLFPDPDQVRPRFLLKGEIPSPINLPQGCYLFSRCPLAQTGWCEQSVPPLEALTDTRSIACLPVVTEYRRGVSLEEFGLLQHGIAIDHEDSLATGKALQGQNPG